MLWAEKNYTAAGIVFISVILVLFILRKEYKKRMSPDMKATSNNIYYVWLNRWSFLSILSCLIAGVLYTGRYLPYICIAAVGIDQAFLYITKVIIGFYQIARLQYCFLDKQIHSKKYGYSQALFIFLYINGGLQIIFILIFGTLFLYKTESHGPTGCSRPFHPYWWVYFVFCVIWYCLWDWLILVLYISKIIQIHRKKSSYAKVGDEPIIKRVRLILHKISVLTIVLEISSLLTTGILQYFVVRPFQSEWHGIIINAMFEGFDISLMASIMFIMIDHNEAMYLKVVMFLDKMYCCICCQCLIDQQTIEKLYSVTSVKYSHQDEDNQRKNDNNQGDTVNLSNLSETQKKKKETMTDTKSDQDHTVKMKHSTHVFNSKSEKSAS